MLTIFTKLHDAIKSAAATVGLVKRETVTKKAFADNVAMLTTRYTTLIECINAMLESDRQALADRIYNNKNANDYAGCLTYIHIASELKSTADTRRAFESIRQAAKSIDFVLRNFQANVEVIFEGGADINIHTAKLSHLAAFGFIEKAETFIEFAMDLFDIITYEVVQTDGTAELEKPLPYKYKYIKNNEDGVIAFMKSLTDGGDKTYINTFKTLKTSVDDVKVANPETGSNIELVGDDKLLRYHHGLFGQWSLNPFRWLGEQWVLIRNNKYVKINAEKEAMLAHVDLLRLQLAEKDPNSKEYAKLVKVIESYNKMIANMQSKLDKYYGENNQ